MKLRVDRQHPARLTGEPLEIAIVIDVLRATSTAVVFLARGAPGIAVVASPADLPSLPPSGGPYLYVSEIERLTAPGDRIDNSPVQAEQVALRGRTPVLITTNGTRALDAAAGAASQVLVASFLNVSAVASHLERHRPSRVTLLPAGDFETGDSRPEDDLCADALEQWLGGGRPDLRALANACRGHPPHRPQAGDSTGVRRQSRAVPDARPLPGGALVCEEGGRRRVAGRPALIREGSRNVRDGDRGSGGAVPKPVDPIEAVIDGWLLPRPAAGTPMRPRVVALGGDGIGPEVVTAALRCLRATDAPLEIVEPIHGQRALDAQGTAFPEELKAIIRASDATLFGAVGTISNDILRFLRFHLDCYANIRPSAWLPQIRSRTGQKGTDLVIVRELTEGMYPGKEGTLEEFHQRWPEFKDRLGRPIPRQGRFALRVMTDEASSRVGRFAARLAAHRKRLGRGRGKLTIVTKLNVLPQTDGIFLQACERESALVGDLEIAHLYVDEAARRLVADPGAFDVIVTSNLFGDILSDIAAETMGGLPLAPSAGIGDGHVYFEPVHGSAPDIAGQGKANPGGAILSAAMLLSHFGYAGQARALVRALLETLWSGIATADLGGTADTESVTQAVCDRL